MLKNIKRNRFIKSLNANGIFDNSYEKRFPQTYAAKIIESHFENCTKKPKCLFIGWDGCRADAMKYLIKSSSSEVSGCNSTAVYSAAAAVKKSGGLYITYTGAQSDLPQETSTAQGWASALCGKWMKKKWRHGIEWSLDSDYPTVMKLLSLKGFKTSFSAIWPVHFDNTYKYEIEYAELNNLSQYYYKFEDDNELHRNLIERINAEDDFIIGIYENPDNNGHQSGFGDSNYRYVSGICNLDKLSYTLLCEIKNRETFCEEDWLIIIASDHGGHSTMHGTQKIEDKTTFMAVSKPIDCFIL